MWLVRTSAEANCIDLTELKSSLYTVNIYFKHLNGLLCVVFANIHITT